MITPTTTPYQNILNAINNNTGLTKDLFDSYIQTVNGESIFELNEKELVILEFIRSQGRKISLKLEIIQENPKTGVVVKKFTPNEKITSDLISYKYSPFQYVISIN